ncbi:MAG: thiamine phosphate synthase [Acidimicrobiia bacterium]
MADRQGDDRRRLLAEATLYFCVPDRPDLASVVASVCAAGVDVVQLREKRLDDRALLARAALARDAAWAAGALFILNDRPDLALACGADGVHVGQDDVAPSVCRAILGPDRLVGLSTHAPDELAASATLPVDYVSVGPVEATPTKPGRPGTGLGYASLAADTAGVVFFVTGGVSAETLPALLGLGVRRVVVVRAIADALDPAVAARGIRELLPRGQLSPGGP